MTGFKLNKRYKMQAGYYYGILDQQKMYKRAGSGSSSYAGQRRRSISGKSSGMTIAAIFVQNSPRHQILDRFLSDPTGQFDAINEALLSVPHPNQQQIKNSITALLRGQVLDRATAQKHNKKSTIKAKGFDLPFFDTSQTLQAMDARIMDTKEMFTHV